MQENKLELEGVIGEEVSVSHDIQLAAIIGLYTVGLILNLLLLLATLKDNRCVAIISCVA